MDAEWRSKAPFVPIVATSAGFKLCDAGSACVFKIEPSPDLNDLSLKAKGQLVDNSASISG